MSLRMMRTPLHTAIMAAAGCRVSYRCGGKAGVAEDFFDMGGMQGEEQNLQVEGSDSHLSRKRGGEGGAPDFYYYTKGPSTPQALYACSAQNDTSKSKTNLKTRAKAKARENSVPHTSQRMACMGHPPKDFGWRGVIPTLAAKAAAKVGHSGPSPPCRKRSDKGGASPVS